MKKKHRSLKTARNMFFCEILLLLIIPSGLSGQVLVSATQGTADDCAIFELESTSKGFLPPRMTTAERNSIMNPSEGLVIYNTDTKSIFVFDGTLWKNPTTDFSCGDQIMDADNHIYNTIRIGNQCWIAENLNVGTMIPSVDEMVNDGTSEKYCYNNDPAKCVVYGGLYQWDEMMQYSTTAGARGVCPKDWHIPSDEEWKSLEEYLGMCTGTGSGCSEATGWRGTDQGSQLGGNAQLWIDGALDQNQVFGNSGFNALPAGYRTTSGTFDNHSEGTLFWSSSQSGTSAWDRSLDYAYSKISRSTDLKSLGLSVRCIRNE